eukprot:scaffold2895_cov279-Chaetoceros_neogracile.AAC.7
MRMPSGAGSWKVLLVMSFNHCAALHCTVNYNSISINQSTAVDNSMMIQMIAGWMVDIIDC